MLFDVKPILHTPGKRLEFQFELDLSDVEFSGRYPVSRPVAITGQVRNTADVLELELTARTTLDAMCDRCGKEFPQDKEVTYSCVLAEGWIARWPEDRYHLATYEEIQSGFRRTFMGIELRE